MTSVIEDGEIGGDKVVGEKSGTLHDVEDMKRMGKEQLFKVCAVIPSDFNPSTRHLLTGHVHRSETLASCPFSVSR